VREEVAEAARICAKMGLVDAFGHVSSRRPEGGFVISSTRPMLSADPAEMIEVDDEGAPTHGDAGHMPLETPLHAAVYAAREDVGGICRTHSPHAASWGAREKVPPLADGLAGLSGTLALHRPIGLVTSMAAGEAAAADLGSDSCLLIRANGMVCTGADLRQALVRAWYLEKRSAAANLVPDCGVETAEWEERASHYPVETERAWNWIAKKFGEGAL